MEENYDPHSDPYIIECKEKIRHLHSMITYSSGWQNNHNIHMAIEDIEKDIDRHIHNMDYKHNSHKPNNFW